MSHGCVLAGRAEVGEGWEAGGEVTGFVIVVSQNVGAAAASSFALVLCLMGSFQSSLAGARRGQVVTVLVLGPKPQPLLVLLLWFFGSVLP